MAHSKNNPYVFISYAHQDEKTVMPIITAVRGGGIKLWYDNGIEAGSEWPEYIAQKIIDCDRIICFISNAYLKSQNCKRELNFAISEKKELLSVFIEPVELSAGMKMQLGSYQALFLDRYRNAASFSESLIRENFLKNCRIASKYNTQRQRAAAAEEKALKTPAKKEEEPKPVPTEKAPPKTPSSVSVKRVLPKEKPLKKPVLYTFFTIALLLVCILKINDLVSSISTLQNSELKYVFIQSMIFSAILAPVNMFLISCIVPDKAMVRRRIILFFCIFFTIAINSFLCPAIASIGTMFKLLTFITTFLLNAFIEFLLFIIMAITDA